VEVVALGALCAAAGVGLFAPELGLRAASASSLPASGVPPLGRQELTPLRRAPTTAELTGTFLGMSDDLLLERMRTSRIVKSKLNHGGSSLSIRLEFEDGSRAAFKPLQIHPQTVPRKEIAAYRLNRLLGFHAVPPATGRVVSKTELLSALPADGAAMARRIEKEGIFDAEGLTRGEVSYWIPAIADSHLDELKSVLEWWQWLTIGQELPAPKRHLMEQLSSLLVFDLLTNNSDRFSGGNLQMDPTGQTLFWMDNTFGFQLDPEGHTRCRIYFGRVQKFSRHLVSSLRTLTYEQLKGALAVEEGLLTEPEARAVLMRRDVALRHIDGLIAQHGEAQVLVFP
jgi:hypothetical protein